MGLQFLHHSLGTSLSPTMLFLYLLHLKRDKVNWLGPRKLTTKILCLGVRKYLKTYVHLYKTLCYIGAIFSWCFSTTNWYCNMKKYPDNQPYFSRGGPLWPPYHDSVCCCYKLEATVTKVPNFVPFDICQVPRSQFWFLCFKKIEKIGLQKFGGSSNIRRKSEKIWKFSFFH